MKLRNKKTGEIIEVESLDVDSPTEGIVGIPSFDRKGSYNSLAELNEEWEDYRKEYWHITWCGDVVKETDDGTSADKDCKVIGNYFETKEEAEKAVEKLKAWKRLKDKGFRITLQGCKGNAWLQANWGNLQGDYSDILLLFGGEE